MENLEIISTITSVQGKEVINQNTAVYSWNFNGNEKPEVVNFQVRRGVVGNPNYTGNNVITGAYYSNNQKFDVQNNSFQSGDFVLYQAIIDRCVDITSVIEAE